MLNLSLRQLPSCYWTLWYKCLVCQRCYEHKAKFIEHKTTSPCSNRYQAALEENQLRERLRQAIIKVIDISDDDDDDRINSKNEADSDSSSSSVLVQPAKGVSSSSSSHIPQPGPSSKLITLPESLLQSKESEIHSEAETDVLSESDLPRRICPLRRNVSIEIISEVKHGIKDSMEFECYFCYASFRYHSSLEKHMRIHTNELEYKCNKCREFFKYRFQLMSHKRLNKHW